LEDFVHQWIDGGAVSACVTICVHDIDVYDDEVGISCNGHEEMDTMMFD
jgi:hypothetical protein